MQIVKLPLIALIVVLSSILFVGFIRPVQASSFNPAFGVSLSSNSPAANSDMTLTTTQPSGDELLDKVTFKVPAGWTITSGSSVADGAIVGSGSVSFVYLGEPQNVNFTLTNFADTQSHLARWNLVLPDPFCCLVINVDGSTASGYSFTVDPLLPIETPLNFSLTLSGVVGGVPLLTNPSIGGDYVWSADYVSPSAVTVTRNQTLSLPGTVTPSGSNVTADFNNGSSVTFSTVGSAGATTIATSTTVPPGGTGQFQVSNGLYYDFNTTFDHSSSCPCTVTIPYDPSTSNPRIYHSENGVWVDVTTFVDTVNYKVTGVVSSFSFFTVAQPDFGLQYLDPVAALWKKTDVLQLDNGRVIPLNFTLTDANGGFVSSSDVKVQVINNSDNTQVGVISAEALKNHYMANLDLKSLNLINGTYKIRVLVGNTVYSPTLLFNKV